MDHLQQVAILGNPPVLGTILVLFDSAMKFSFMTQTTSICHISRQVSLVSFTTGMSVVRMTVHISSVNDLEVPLTNLYNCVDPHENHIGSQGNTHTHTLLPEGHDTQTSYRRPLSLFRNILTLGITRDESRTRSWDESQKMFPFQTDLGCPSGNLTSG